MDEGVDPKQMCQSLVDKVTRSEQLSAIADPDVLLLFEDWLEELESEAQKLLKTHGPLNEKSLADRLGLSSRGAKFLLSELERKGNRFG